MAVEKPSFHWGRLNNHCTGFVPVAALQDLQALPRHETMEVNGSILVPFRHKDVTQPTTANHVVRPGIELLRDGFHIVPVHPGRIQGKCHEILEFVGQRQAAQLRPCSAHGAQSILTVSLLSSLTGTGTGFQWSLHAHFEGPRRNDKVTFPSGKTVQDSIEISTLTFFHASR